MEHKIFQSWILHTTEFVPEDTVHLWGLRRKETESDFLMGRQARAKGPQVIPRNDGEFSAVLVFLFK